MTDTLPFLLRYEDIEARLNQGKLLTNITKDSLQSTSYDLRVGTIFKDGKIINEAHDDGELPFQVEPGEIVSIFTLEELDLPHDVAGLAFAMNKKSSEGLLVLNPGHIDPGYQGPLTVKALNLSKTIITVQRKDPIFTILFFNIGHATTHPYTKSATNRDTKERELHRREQEIAAKSLVDIVLKNKDFPFMTKEDVNQAIKLHWATIASLAILAITAVTSIVAAVAVLCPPAP